jgi:phosphopantothenoylcysteine decarboxylase/phosphopantothenate--cysteine ligase
MLLSGKNIIIAVTGSIAAYKTPELVRQLVKKGANVKVLMTPSAAQFVTPLSLATVSKHEVYSAITENDQWHNHVHLGRWADLMIIAPCSANTLAKMANGLCDNILLAVYLSATCPVVIAPAMDEDMWYHPSTKKNIQTLLSFHNYIIDPAHGELASGLTGPGRMAEPHAIVEWSIHFLTIPIATRPKALVTAGPTFEAIDPVRFIGNHSSGKMGIALAEALANKGYYVNLVLGPTHLGTDHPFISTQRVMSADDMFEACEKIYPACELAILAAAVADFKPATIAAEKIKKGDNTTMDIQLVSNKDILLHLGKHKQEHQTLVGFALETNNIFANATIKLKKKNADFIVLNTLGDPGAGFGFDTNKVYIINKNGQQTDLPLQAKSEVAKQIVDHILVNK